MNDDKGESGNIGGLKYKHYKVFGNDSANENIRQIAFKQERDRRDANEHEHEGGNASGSEVEGVNSPTYVGAHESPTRLERVDAPSAPLAILRTTPTAFGHPSATWTRCVAGGERF